MQTITSIPGKRENSRTANRPRRVMQAYQSWVNRRKESRKPFVALHQPLDPDALNDELINALA